MAYTTLRIGSSGQDVKTLQTALNKRGFSLNVDGVFGENTENAVKTFQSQNGLTVDGIVGSKTWNVLLKNSVDHDAIGKAFVECINDIESLPSFKKLVKLIG